MEKEVLLSIENLTVRYGKEITLQIESPILIEEGDRVGIIGSNGAGKSTLIRSVLGLVNYQGNIRTRLTPEQMATILMGYAVRQAQDFEKGIPERMQLFGIRNYVTICNREIILPALGSRLTDIIKTINTF